MITLTDAAAHYIKSMLAQKSAQAVFRLSLKKTGCSGYSYAPEIRESETSDDLCVDIGDLKVYIDAQYQNYLRGLLIDYREEQTQLGLKQKKLIFSNPNEEGRCGCGESFHVEKP